MSMFPSLQGTKLPKCFQCSQNWIEAKLSQLFLPLDLDTVLLSSVTLTLKKLSLLRWDAYPQNHTGRQSAVLLPLKESCSRRAGTEATRSCPRGRGALVLPAFPTPQLPDLASLIWSPDYH